MSYLDGLIAELQSGDGGGLRLTTREVRHLRAAMAHYALSALMDSEVAREAESVCQDTTQSAEGES